MEDDDRGYSNVLVHTEKGKGILEAVEGIRYLDANPERVFEFTGGMERKSITCPEACAAFYNQLNEKIFETAVRQFVKVTWLDHVIERLKPVRTILREKLGKHR